MLKQALLLPLWLTGKLIPDQHKPLTVNVVVLTSCKCALAEEIFDYVCVLGVSQFLPRGCTHSPVFKFLAVDAHSSLVALSDTHLVSAALNLLTGVLGGVYIWEKIENEIFFASLFALFSIFLF